MAKAWAWLGEDVPVNVTYVVLGIGMLWFGWFGFNAGSELAADTVAAQAFLTTNTATAAAMVTWEVLSGLAGKKLSAPGIQGFTETKLVWLIPEVNMAMTRPKFEMKNDFKCPKERWDDSSIHC